MKKAKKTKSNKKNLLPILSLVLGFILGGALIGLGVYNNINSTYNSFEVRSEEDLKKEIDAKEAELTKLYEERDKEYETSALSDEYENISRKISALNLQKKSEKVIDAMIRKHISSNKLTPYKISAKENETTELYADLNDVKNGFYDNLKAQQYLSSVPLIVLGVVVIVFGMGLSMKLSTKSKKNVILSVTEEK